MFRKFCRSSSRIKLLRPLAGLLVMGLSFAAFAAAQSQPYPTYVTGPQPNGSWVVGNGQVLTPAGKQVDLGIRVRAKAIALNPNVQTHTAAVLTMGTRGTTDGAVEIFRDSCRSVPRMNKPPAAFTCSCSVSVTALCRA